MYSTNLTETQWQFIKRYLINANRKRKHILREMWDALFYLVKTGCQWRMLPKEFPKWQLVYYYYSQWLEEGIFDFIMDKLRIKARLNKNQNAEASAGIIDSQTVRWGNNRSLKSVDGNKKIKGIKRHVVVDKNGWLLAIMVSVAHIHDSKAAELLMRTLKERLIGIKLLIADGGYRGELAEKIKTKFGYMLQVILRSDKKSNDFKPLPMRWVVERTFAWFDNDRRLCRNYELLIDSAETMVKIATIKLLLNKI